MPTVLRIGSRGFDVAVVQAQLNAKNSSGSRVKVDGDFRLLTHTAVVAFQRRVGLPADGIIGPQTHSALAEGLPLSTANHNVIHIAQPTCSTCWAASTAMMTRSSIAEVLLRTPAHFIGPNGLLNSSETDQAWVTGTRFGKIFGLRCHAPMSWSVAALLNALRRSPLMFDMLWRPDEYVAGIGSPGHMIVVSAVVSDNNESGSGTHLLVNDPWPPTLGKLSWVEYSAWMNAVPTRSYRVFER